MEFEILDPEVMNFCGHPIKIITDEDKKYLGDYHRVATFECDIQGIDRDEHILFAGRGIGFFIKDYSKKQS